MKCDKGFYIIPEYTLSHFLPTYDRKVHPMIHKIVAIFDRKAEAFLKPVFVQSNGAAVRSFGDAVNDETTEFHKHPEDYTMFSLGEWNDSTGVFDQFDPIEIAKAITFKND